MWLPVAVDILHTQRDHFCTRDDLKSPLCSRVCIALPTASLNTEHSATSYGRGARLGRGRRVGVRLATGVAVVVAVGVGDGGNVAVGVGVNVAVAVAVVVPVVAVGVNVGVGVGVGLAPEQSLGRCSTSSRNWSASP